MKCKEWWNGGMCSKKFNFISRLPFNVVKNSSLAVRLATVVLCKGCPHRMFILPKYACDPKSVLKYRLFWKNRLALSKILDDEDDIVRVEEKPLMLMTAIRRRRK